MSDTPPKPGETAKCASNRRSRQGTAPRPGETVAVAHITAVPGATSHYAAYINLGEVWQNSHHLTDDAQVKSEPPTAITVGG